MSMSLRLFPPVFLGIPSLSTLLGFAPRPKTPRGTPPSRPQPAPAPAPRGDRGIEVDRLLAAARTVPKLSLLEWDGDGAKVAPAKADSGGPHTFTPARRKIRDRYIAARFVGLARCSADLANVPVVVSAARMYFEDGAPDLALELLGLAVEEAPQQSALWLAHLEILFLLRARDPFVETARAFREVHRFHEAWEEVGRLGRAIAPGEALFGTSAGPRDHEQYGPWPHLPNWIEAPWDLTAEVTAADFHRALAQK